MVPTNPQAVKDLASLKKEHNGPFLNVSQEDWEKLQKAQNATTQSEDWRTLQRWLRDRYLKQAPDQEDMFDQAR